MNLLENAYAVIIAGGEGRRLWPLSTPEKPKQFISVFDGKPLIRHAIERLSGLIPPERTIVITAKKFKPLTQKALPEIPAENIIGEPCRRDTAGAIAIACAIVKRLGGDNAIGCILASDHIIKPAAGFRRTLKDAVHAARNSNAIVTVGIDPERPATEYGYIECGGKVELNTRTAFERVLRFREKPSAATARKYIKSKRYLWNAGMFIWKAKTLENAFSQCAEDIGGIIGPLSKSGNFTATLKKLYPTIRTISFDYAVMEKTSDILVARSSFQWDDVGSWSALSRHLPCDKNKNILIGDVVAENSRSITAISTVNKRLVLAGLNDAIVVNTRDFTLVASKDAASDMKRIAEKALQA